MINRLNNCCLFFLSKKIVTYFCPQNNFINLLPMLAKAVVACLRIAFGVCGVDRSTAIRSRKTLSQRTWAQPTHRSHIQCETKFQNLAEISTPTIFNYQSQDGLGYTRYGFPDDWLHLNCSICWKKIRGKKMLKNSKNPNPICRRKKYVYVKQKCCIRYWFEESSESWMKPTKSHSISLKYIYKTCDGMNPNWTVEITKKNYRKIIAKQNWSKVARDWSSIIILAAIKSSENQQ